MGPSGYARGRRFESPPLVGPSPTRCASHWHRRPHMATGKRTNDASSERMARTRNSVAVKAVGMQAQQWKRRTMRLSTLLSALLSHDSVVHLDVLSPLRTATMRRYLL